LHSQYQLQIHVDWRNHPKYYRVRSDGKYPHENMNKAGGQMGKAANQNSQVFGSDNIALGGKQTDIQCSLMLWQLMSLSKCLSDQMEVVGRPCYRRTHLPQQGFHMEHTAKCTRVWRYNF
jgi:hypothetical protein